MEWLWERPFRRRAGAAVALQKRQRAVRSPQEVLMARKGLDAPIVSCSIRFQGLRAKARTASPAFGGARAGAGNSRRRRRLARSLLAFARALAPDTLPSPSLSLDPLLAPPFSPPSAPREQGIEIQACGPEEPANQIT